MQAGEKRSARVESLRALAALGVLGGHVYGTARGFNTALGHYSGRLVLGGGFGVMLFFALTGYLLYRPFARAAFAGAGRTDLSRYALNRALRILPLYYTVIVVMLLAQEHGGTPRQWLLFGLFAENFASDTMRQVDGVVWSLVIEMQFYLLLPLLAAGLAWLARGSLGRAALLVGGLGSMSLALHLLTVTGATPDPRWQYSLPVLFFHFTAGMLLALGCIALERRPLPALRHARDALALFGVACWAVVCWRYDLEPLLALGSACLLGAVVLPLPPGRLVRALDWRLLAGIGVASYSLYLWHLPIVEHLGTRPALAGHLWLSAAVFVPLCLAVAYASYRIVEEPFLRLRRRWSPAAPPHERGIGAPELDAPYAASP